MSPIHAQQLLHGYRSGHGQIAGSIKLAARDSELVTRLSDLSGTLSSGVQIEPYLTVYPLPSQQFFGIARTWPDPEAQRAGCVLTHTLLVPLEEWGTLREVRSLMGLFRNPHRYPDYSFSEPIPLQDRAQNNAPEAFEIDLQRSCTFVSRYFGQGLRPLIWFSADEPEEYLWRLLEHLWPKLRTVFSCCTFSLQQRTLNDRPFDLLFAPSIVYSRFTRLSPDHLIEPAIARKASSVTVEPWSDYWAKVLFSAAAGPPANESELSIWTELNEDPTAIRKLSLAHELRLRAAQSPTAGVGAMDVVESLARDATSAISLKRLVLENAIDATTSADSAADSLASLRLIEDRLHRESFRNVAGDFYGRLSSAASAVTSRDPETALQLSSSWLADRRMAHRNAFADGVMTGLLRVAGKSPARMDVLRSYPEVAVELLRLEPTFASTYFEVGGDEAANVLAVWLSSTSDANTLREVRQSLLPSLRGQDKTGLLSALLRDVPEEEVAGLLNALATLSNNFADQSIRDLVIDRISSMYPQSVRVWGSTTKHWSLGAASIVASTYGHNRQGYEELLHGPDLQGIRQADALATMLCDQTSSGTPYWLRDLISHDVKIIRTLLLAKGAVSDTSECALARVLQEVSDLSLASSDELLESVSRFEGRRISRQLLDAAAHSALASYVADNRDTHIVREYLTNSPAMRWMETVPVSELSALLVRSSSSGAAAVERALQWLSKAPNALYARQPSALPDLLDSLLPRIRQFPSENVQYPLIEIMRRAGVLPGYDLRQILSAKLLRFSFDNVHLLLSELVTEIFADVYSEAIEEQRRPSIFFNLFGGYEWDKGKDLRIALIETFQRSDWPAGDLAISARRAEILRKVFKRLHRKQAGDNYLRKMLANLNGRTGPEVSKTRQDLESLMKDPDFYEEWD